MNKSNLIEAVKKQNIIEIKQIVEEHPEQTNQSDERGFPPLLYASQMGDKTIVDLLLQYKPDINARDAAGNTALMGVSFKGN